MLITTQEAFEQKLRDIFIISEGIVAEMLPNDITGVPHQRFIILTSSGQTLLIVHNIDRGDQIDINIGDKVHVEGTYVWNHYGGIIHETHVGLNKHQPEGSLVKKD